MKKLTEHIDALDVLMKKKGYDGHFLCGSGHPGTLKESMQAYFQEKHQEQIPVSSFYLSTYSHWKNVDRPYVQCDFKIQFSPATGFEVRRMELTRANAYGVVKSLELHPDGNDEIPTREQANQRVGQKAKRLKI